MASVNKKVINRELNYEGVPAARINPKQQLERSVMSCMLWENEFYEDGQTISSRISDLVRVVSAPDVSAIAIKAKEDMRLRHTPLLLARELLRTKEGLKQIGNLIPKVINRVDDITEILAMYLSEKKGRSAKLPNQLKKHLGEAFKKFDEYSLAKYNGGKKTVSLKDALKLTHPKADSLEQSALWKRVLTGTLATPDTWEVEISSSKDKKASWERLLKEDKLGGLAMLRNIRNMREAGVSEAAIKKGIKGIKAGKLLPINFISAARHNPQFEDVIEQKFYECFTKDKIDGDTVILIDISPSMNVKLSAKSELTRTDVACSLAMVAREMFSDVRVFSFSTDCVEVPPRRGFGLRDAILNSQRSNGTMLGKALAQVPKYDRLIVITDEESQDPVPQMKGYMVNVASTKNGIGYGIWTHIDGWSDRILNYIIQHEKTA